LKTNNDITAVLFDLDGTLLDTRDLILASFRHATQEVMGTTVPDEALLRLVGIPLAEQCRIFYPENPDLLCDVYREHNHRVHDELVRDFAGMKDALEELKGEGYRLAVITSKRHKLAWHGLECFGLERYFEILIGSDDFPEHKPEPGPLLEAARRMGLAPERCCYVGDSPFDMQAARSANMLAVGVLWGMFTREELLEAGAQRLAKEPHELNKSLAS
jgi:pyrophosphatase PpaX